MINTEKTAQRIYIRTQSQSKNEAVLENAFEIIPQAV
jgi:hypothetical protein